MSEAAAAAHAAPGQPAPHLYLITDRHATGGRPLPEVIAEALSGLALPGGAGPAARVAVQLREKDLPGRPLLALALTLREITRAAGVAFYVNDRVDVALASGADGVHLGAGALSVAEARRIAPALRVAVSIHGQSEIPAAASAGASFAVFGPVFDTPSKRALGTPQGLAALAQAARVGRDAGLPVLALGGITPENAAACLGAGAAGLACIRSVISVTNSSKEVARFLACFMSSPTHFDT